MDLQQTISPVPSGTASSNTQFTILDPRDAVKYMKMAQGEPHFLKLIRETFTITHTFTKGLTPAELEILIGRTTQIPKKRILEQVKLLSEGQTTLLASTEIERKLRNSWIVRAEYQNGKFDILSVYATQTKELNPAKVAACGLGALTLCTLGFIVNPFLGVGAVVSTSVVAAAVANKEYKDYCECPPDVIYGPIFEYLCDKNVWNVSQGYN